MEIRQASRNDAVAIVENLWLPFAQEMAELDDYNTLADDPREDAVDHRREKLSQADYCVQITVEDSTFVGFASAEVQPSAPVFDRGSTLAISEAYVRPEWRQQGIASALLDAIEAWGNKREYETISLTVNTDNHAAKAFYENCGFETKRLQMVKSPR